MSGRWERVEEEGAGVSKEVKWRDMREREKV